MVFLLHGRRGAAQGVFDMALEIQSKARAQNKPVLIVLVEHRNHGKRQLDSALNGGKKALDMYSILRGTAQDVTFLADFLPAKLGLSAPDLKFGVVGVSLGAHCALVLVSTARDKFAFCAALIGCADFARMITSRIASADAEPAQVLGKHFVSLLERDGALSNVPAFRNTDLLLFSTSGDTLCPQSMNDAFIQALHADKANRSAKLAAKVFEHDSHAVTPDMQTETIDKLLEWFC